MYISLVIIIPFFLMFFFSCVRLYFLETKIMKRLRVVDQARWEALRWFSSRAHPIRFRKFTKSSDLSDSIIKEYTEKYKRTARFGFITWGVFALITVTLLLGFVASCTFYNTIKLEVKENEQGNIVIKYSIPDRDSLSRVNLYKSVLDLKRINEIDIYADPISCVSLPNDAYSGTIIDSYFCRGYEYSFYISAISKRTGRPYFFYNEFNPGS